jgi:hypothetical protein
MGRNKNTRLLGRVFLRGREVTSRPLLKTDQRDWQQLCVLISATGEVVRG